MKKNLISLAVAASVAGVAASTQAAMYLNPEGTGQVLLFPFYNAENGNETSMHIVNTTADAKAVKVRVLEYVNSQEVLDFNLYLSPYDEFAFTIYQNPNGDGGALVTGDNSCTVPALGTPIDANENPLNGFVRASDGAKVQPFLPYQYTNAPKDALNSIVRTMQGHVEIIEMGVLGASGTFTPKAWATHDSKGVPNSCAKLVGAWDPDTGVWAASAEGAKTAITAATGGLYGLSNHLNNQDAASFGIEPAAIADFWGTNPAFLHTDPGTLTPSLGSGVKSAIVNNGGSASTLTYATGHDAVSALFMQDWLYNDVMVNTNIGGMTDWVITFPTKREYVNLATAVAPFAEIYGLKGATKYTYAGLACEDIKIKQWNREESTPVGDGAPQFSPKPDITVVTNELCLETNVIAVGAATAGSALNVTLQTTGNEWWPGKKLNFIEGETEGWMRMGFQETTQKLRQADGSDLQGLPAMGFAAYKYVNSNMSFGFVSDHKGNVCGSAVTNSCG